MKSVKSSTTKTAARAAAKTITRRGLLTAVGAALVSSRKAIAGRPKCSCVTSDLRRRMLCYSRALMMCNITGGSPDDQRCQQIAADAQRILDPAFQELVRLHPGLAGLLDQYKERA